MTDSSWPSLPRPTPYTWQNPVTASTTGDARPHEFRTSGIKCKSESEVKAIIEATTSICKILSTGLENQVVFVSVVNEILSKYGIPTIEVPKHFLEYSRNKFF